MYRALALTLFALATPACVDDMGGHPISEEPAAEAHCVGRLCLGEATRAEMAARADALAACVPVEQAWDDPQRPDGLTVGGIDLIEVEGEPTLEVQLLNLDPRGFYGYPGLSVEVLDGDAHLLDQWNGAAGPRQMEQYYGIAGCSRYTLRVRIEPRFGDGEPITLRAAATVLHAPAAQDEWVFVLDPR